MKEGLYTESWIHGGDVYRNDVQCDFSVSVNPLGMPAEAKRVYREAERKLQQYPDPENEALVRAISARYEVPEEEILCGSGASGILTAAVMALRPERVLLPVPSFSGYRAAIRAVETVTGRAVVTEFFLLREEDGFSLDERFLRRLQENRQYPDLIILCNPNNPTGREIRPEILRETAGRVFPGASARRGGEEPAEGAAAVSGTADPQFLYKDLRNSRHPRRVAFLFGPRTGAEDREDPAGVGPFGPGPGDCRGYIVRGAGELSFKVPGIHPEGTGIP